MRPGRGDRFRRAPTTELTTEQGCRAHEMLAFRRTLPYTIQNSFLSQKQITIDIQIDFATISRMAKPREYRIWKLMRQRCMNPRNAKYHRYGGRGIIICERWNDFQSFLIDMGPAPSSKHTIERVDNNGAYEPGNCRWATRKEQSRNTSQNRVIEWCGEKMCLSAWAERLGLQVWTLLKRLDRMPLHRAMQPGRLYRDQIVIVNGECGRLADFARKQGISIKTVRSRIRAGRTIEQALGLRPFCDARTNSRKRT